MDSIYFSLSKNAKLVGMPANCEVNFFVVGLIWNGIRECFTLLRRFEMMLVQPSAWQLQMLNHVHFICGKDTCGYSPRTFM
jgi:hypothetical protein